jgi:hypothetical protein
VPLWIFRLTAWQYTLELNTEAFKDNGYVYTVHALCFAVLILSNANNTIHHLSELSIVLILSDHIIMV